MRPGRTLEDRAWRGYDPRAAVPAAAAAVAASAALVAARFLLDAQPGRSAALAFYGSVLAVWPLLLGRAAYRVIVRTYRLTDRAILVDWGPFVRPEPPLWLSEVSAVSAGAGWLGRRLGVGWVELRENSSRVLRLSGVRDPAAFAAEVRALVTASPTPPPP